MDFGFWNQDETNTGEYYSIAASNIDHSLYQPKFLVQMWQTFDKINLYLSCSFLMHVEGTSCIPNEPGDFSLSPLGEDKRMKCHEYSKDCTSFECETLKFICNIKDESFPSKMILYMSIIVGSLVVLTCGLCIAFCVLRKKLADAQRVNSEVSAAVREAEE